MAKKYIEGFVLPVAVSRLEEYEKIAETAAGLFKEHGALEYWECVGDDLSSEGTLSFVELIEVGEDETVIFAWISYASREARDAANESIMQDERFIELMNQEDPVVDFQRMAQGGFRELVHR